VFASPRVKVDVYAETRRVSKEVITKVVRVWRLGICVKCLVAAMLYAVRQALSLILQ
jgi:hypothetical protein